MDRYAGSATTPAALGVTIFSGGFNANDANSTGAVTGIEDNRRSEWADFGRVGQRYLLHILISNKWKGNHRWKH
jgi:hypothetical protein